ncbi:hypothetical protein P43SY_007324 [Pythium insidiosum]|uniref:Uncharacterized protein n=1 Tax=Pythium insidiosum TaxID=114742 RepID=A0AAD5Q942_PYTIN|nr:hypothetical protein P43SY_007324 [Pythium insidiosum]
MHHPKAPAPSATTDDTPSNGTQQFVDLSTPSPTSRHLQQNTLSASKLGAMRPQINAPHMSHAAAQSKPTSFLSSDQFVVHTINGASTAVPAGTGHPRRRRRPNVDALMRSSMMSQRLSSMHAKPSFVGPPAGSDVVSVPILGDCAFEAKYTIRFSQDDVGPADVTPMAQLAMLRETMASMTNKAGRLDRATLSQAFEVAPDDAAARAGIENLTKSLSVEWASSGINSPADISTSCISEPWSSSSTFAEICL